MDSNAIETLSISAVRDSIDVCKYLQQYIESNDKSPSWDGYVNIYDGTDKAKAHMKGRMPVQVKGKECTDHSAEAISFSADVSDLRNYLYDGGAMYFVVLIDPSTYAKKIYFTELTPIKLRVLLDSLKDNQQTKTIELKAFPEDNDLKANIFLSCRADCDKQASFKTAELLSLEDLEKSGLLESLTFSVYPLGFKDYKEAKLSPVPVVIGMSATAARFNTLVGDTTSTLQKVVISPAQVRASGLLKDRIVITYPEDPTKHGDMAVLQAATDEWISKCQHWYQYTYEQHYSNVNPVFVIQVAAGTGKKISDTDLDDVIAKVEERLGDTFKEGEVVHTFGSTGTIQINGLNVPHVEPSEIADNRKIRVVLFKENLSTGWDCPRAETMMSFRHAEDATYIAQLLGRMVRTPLQCHIIVDDSLNDVRLFLPYFNKGTVKSVIDELQSAEGGEIPTVIDGESLEEQVYVPWTVHTRKPKVDTPVPGQITLFQYAEALQTGAMELHDESGSYQAGSAAQGSQPSGVVLQKPKDNTGRDQLKGNDNPETQNPVPVHPQQDPLPVIKVPVKQPDNDSPKKTNGDGQLSFIPELDRESVIRFINESGFLTYVVRSVKINSYLKSLLSLAGLGRDLYEMSILWK